MISGSKIGGNADTGWIVCTPPAPMLNAIVSTPVGCEGIPVVDGKHLLTAESSEGFADCVCRLLEDEALRHRLGSQGMALAAERFAWPTIAEELESHLRRAIERNTPTSESATA